MCPVQLVKLFSFSAETLLRLVVSFERIIFHLLLDWALIPPMAWLIKSHCLRQEGEVWALCIAFWQAAFLLPGSFQDRTTVHNRLLDSQTLGADRYSVFFYYLISSKVCNGYTAAWWIWFNNNILLFVWHLIVYIWETLSYLLLTAVVYENQCFIICHFNKEERLWSLPSHIASNWQPCHYNWDLLILTSVLFYNSHNTLRTGEL